MNTNNIKQWVVLGTVTFVGACGDPPATSDSQSGASMDATTDATNGRPTEASASTSGASASESNATTEDAGSISESATMATTQTTTDGGMTSEVSVGQSGTGAGTSTGGEVSASSTTTGESSSSSSSSSSSTGGAPLGPCEKGNGWTLDADFDTGTLANVNHDPPNGDQLQITLDGFSAPKPYMYIAQTDEGRILKVDTETGKQLARYPSLRLADCPTCNVNPATWAPSRIIIDFDGDMYTANRAFNVQGAVTKIAGSRAGCIDRDGNGLIDTSSDVNNDGIVDINSPAEYKGQDDECILYSLPVAGVNGVLRALTLDGKGHLFVGAFNEWAAYKYDVTQTPPVLVETYALSSRPYGFAIQGDYLYHSGLNWAPTARYDLVNKVGKNMDVTQNYGMTIDSQGIGWYGAQFGLARCDYDDPKNFCDYFNVGEKIWGLTVDHHDQIWAAGAQTLYKFSNEGVLIGQAATPNSYGVAIGHDGNPRVIGWINAFSVESGPVGGPPGAVKTYFTGHLGGVDVLNYTYTDFTGFIAANFTVRKGEWSVIHDGGEANAKWAKVPYNTEPEAKVPASTSITVEVRAADTKAELVNQPWILVVDGALPDFAHGRFIEVRARLLITDPFVMESPVLSDICVLKDGE